MSIFKIKFLFQRDRRNNNQRNAQNYDNRRTNQNNQRNFPNRNNQNKVKIFFISVNDKKIKTGGKSAPPTQFKEDFDFESANAEFETIRKELFENLKISPDKEEVTSKFDDVISVTNHDFRR